MGSDIVINSALRNTLTSIKRSKESLDETSLRISTGNRVNSPLDQPQNFFQAKDLRRTNQNFNFFLDRMGLGLRTIQEALNGLEAIESILELAEIKAEEARDTLEKTSAALPNLILDDEPVGYFRLGDADQPSALNLGTLGAGGDGVYTNGVTQGEEILFYGAGGLPARFDGNNQFIAVPNDDSINENGPFPERTVELIFNADSTSGRQVLWEEGGTVNSLNIYIDNGLLRVNGRTTANGGYGPLDISVPIQSGVTYHVAFTQDGPNSTFTGYLNGQSFGNADLGGAFIGNHPNQNGIGAVNENVYFHDDGPGNSPARPDGTFAFNGQISDVAIYNSIIDGEGMRARYEATSLPLSEEFRLDMVKFLDQIEDITEDSNFRGLNLLRKEDLVVNFDDENESKLRVDGQDFTLEALGLENVNFQKPSQVDSVIRNLRDAVEKVREYATTLVRDISVIQIRQDFTKNFININEGGATDLTIADQNEEGANLLSQQTRLALSTTALSLAGQSSQSILEIFGTGSDLFVT
jgi:flagellin-like hook-associated protein FlgL